MEEGKKGGKKRRHVAENMFRDVKPTSDISVYHGRVCNETVCVWTIFVSVHLRIGFVSEDICIKASRFHFDAGVSVCVYACMSVCARGAWAFSVLFLPYKVVCSLSWQAFSLFGYGMARQRCNHGSHRVCRF